MLVYVWSVTISHCLFLLPYMCDKTGTGTNLYEMRLRPGFRFCCVTRTGTNLHGMGADLHGMHLGPADSLYAILCESTP